MNKFNSADFYIYNYFALYDKNDNVVCYIKDYDELRKRFTNRTLQSIVYAFNHHEEFIYLRLNNEFYKLYTYDRRKEID